MRNIEEIFGGVVENQSQKPWTYIATGLETQEPDGTYSIPIPFVFSTMLCFNNGNLQTEAQVWADSSRIYFIDQLEEGDTLFFLFNSSMSVDRIKAGNISEYKFIVPQGGLESFTVDKKFDHIIVTVNGSTQANEVTCSIVGQTVYPATALEEGDIVYCLLIQGDLDKDDKITNLEAVSRDYKVSVNEVVIGRQETPLDGVKVLFDPIEQTGWLIPDCKGEKIVAFNPPMLKTDKQEIDLTQFNIDRNNFFLKSQYSFEKGFTLQHGLQTVIFEGQECRWDGEFPKVVVVDEGVVDSNWVLVNGTNNNSTIFNVEHFGILHTNSAFENGTAWDRLKTKLKYGDKVCFGANKTYKIDRQIISKNISMIGDNTYIDASGISTNSFGQSGVLKSVLLHCGDSPIILDLKVVNPLIDGDSQITFSGKHNLEIGDWIILYTNQDFSYSTYRAGYHSGQFIQVQKIVDDFTIKSFQPMHQKYESDLLSVYKCSLTPFDIVGIKCIAPGISNPNVLGLVIGNAGNISCQGSGGLNSNDTSFCIYNSVGVRGDKCIGEQTTEKTITNTVTTQYGINIVNSYDCHIGGWFTGYRHAAAYGGTSQQINITTRYCSTRGQYKNLIDSSNICACDFHGNTEYCSHSGTVQANGGAVSFMGNKNKAELTGQVRGVAVMFTELSGVDFSAHFPLLEISGDPTATTPKFRPIDFSGNGAFFGNDIPENSRGTIKLSGKVVAPRITENFAVFANQTAGIKGEWRLDISNLEVIAPSALRIWGMNGTPPLVRAGSVSSSVKLKVGTGGSTTAPYTQFPISFPKPPVVNTVVRQYTTGADRIFSYVDKIEAGRAQIGVVTSSGDNFSQAGEVTVDYTLSLMEF